MKFLRQAKNKYSDNQIKEIIGQAKSAKSLMEAIKLEISNRIKRVDGKLLDEDLIHKPNFDVATAAYLTTRRELADLLDTFKDIPS